MRIPPLSEAREYARHLGVRRAALRAGYVAANKLIALSIFDCLELRAGDVNRDLLRGDFPYTSRFIEADQVPALVGELDPASRRAALEAAERGDSCFAVLDGDRLANIGFYAQGPTPILGDLLVGFDAPRWYMFGAFTPPAYRGRRLHGHGVLNAAVRLFDRGVPALVTVYERTNYRSMVSALRMGWRPCGRLTRVGLGGATYLGRDRAARSRGMRLRLRAKVRG